MAKFRHPNVALPIYGIVKKSLLFMNLEKGDLCSSVSCQREPKVGSKGNILCWWLIRLVPKPTCCKVRWGPCLVAGGLSWTDLSLFF